MQPNRMLIRAAAVVALFASARVDAQCSDGTPFPCRAAARPVPVDPNRIAVLPLRVTTADSLLGEGFAELLAPEFTGEGTPRAVDMSTTIAAWRRAGGGHRNPLSQESAARLARSLGAGKFIQGSVVGAGSRLTVLATVFDASSGSASSSPARAANSVDSLDVLVSQIASVLIGENLQARVREAARLTRNPAAMRAYIEGLALMRRGDFDSASVRFEASIESDSTFASPVYQRWMIASQMVQTSAGRWSARVIAVKGRLTQRERSIVEVQRPDTSRRRTPREALDERRRLAEALGDSPEMWYLYGDQIFHANRLFIPGDSIQPMAKAAFGRALAMDSAALFLQHQFPLAAAQLDTAAMRRMMGSYLASHAPDSWSAAWVAASALNDVQVLNSLRRSGVPKNINLTSGLPLTTTMNLPSPVALADEAARLLVNAADSKYAKDSIAVYHWMLHRGRGRPEAAEKAVAGATPRFWAPRFVSWYWATGDVPDDEYMLRVHGSAPLYPDTASELRRLCLKARLSATKGQFDSVNTAPFQRIAGGRCSRVLDIWREFATNALSDARLALLDTIVAGGSYNDFLGFEHRLLAAIYEARGDTARALWAVRLYPHDFYGAWFAPTLREEGRLYLLNRDTTRAVASYRRYLDLRAETEPLHVAERDSIRALVTTLTRRR